MASDLLHIKDGYFFEVPKLLWPSHRQNANDFADWFVRNDPEFQSQEADRIISSLQSMGIDSGALGSLKSDWEAWKNADAANYSVPLDEYLERTLKAKAGDAKKWAAENKVKATDTLKAYLAEKPDPKIGWFHTIKLDSKLDARWHDLRNEVDTKSFVQSYKDNANWDSHKLEQYNEAMAGKIMIPQLPGAELRNAYEPQRGLCISRYMVIEVVVAILVIILFRWLARKLQSGESPKGKLWNFLESMVQWVRNQIVVPAMGEHDADRFMPFFYTLFFFILGCNLMGMLPFVGAPTAAFGTTLALAVLVFAFGLFLGVKTFGVGGYLKNISPSLGLPWYLGIVIVPMLWVIEAASLLIKHVVLSVRLLLNMTAGHLVMLGILGIGISVEAAKMSGWAWGGIASISVIGTTLLAFLELFVAGLQAFVFTFLAALLIGSSIHHH
jgi:F-type H+-transporting ATPase subunit a